MPFVFAQACVPAVPVWGEKDQYFPIHRVYAIAGNYADHLAELGREEKTEPVFLQNLLTALWFVEKARVQTYLMHERRIHFALKLNSLLLSAKPRRKRAL